MKKGSLLIRTLFFRQDLQDKQDIFVFPACPAESGEERQKESSLFEGNRLLTASKNSRAR